jgi:hypothetical protein
MKPLTTKEESANREKNNPVPSYSLRRVLVKWLIQGEDEDDADHLPNHNLHQQPNNATCRSNVSNTSTPPQVHPLELRIRYHLE